MVFAKLARTTVRVGLCVAALYVVLRGVSVHDALWLRNETTLIGAVQEAGDTFRVSLVGGPTRVIPADEVQTTPAGTLRVAYGLSTIWRHSEKWLMVAAVGVFLAIPFLQALRLHWLLAAQRVHLTFGESIRLAFAGNFMNFAAPLGSTAGDVFKAWYVSRRTPRGVEAGTTVFVDRAVGLGTLLLTVALVALVNSGDARLIALRGQLFVLSGLLVGGVVVMLLPAVRNSRALRGLVERLPRTSAIQKALRTTRELLASPGLLIGAMGVTFVLQVLAAGSFLLLALSLGFRVGPAEWVDLYAYFSSGEIVKAIPGPPQGLGTMELAYQYFFQNWAGASQIVSAAFAIRIVNLICALPGVVFVAGWSHARRGETASASGALATA
ncbi:MAG: flippase-like domain-containing protein [Phycisphaerales bacterium]|nr:flippase-like domain-containing protein [Phycisphaerales bacterium]